jgi:carboxyl-terminal processing protease
MAGKLRKQITWPITLFFIIVILAGGAFYYGYRLGTENPKTITIEGISNLENKLEDGADFGLFWQSWQLLKEKYVDSENLNNESLVRGAISGMFDSLGDDYTVFMPPSDAQKFTEDISGEFSGIGAQIDVRDRQLMVISPLKDSPAEKSGLRPLDKIIKIDDTETDGMTVDDAVKIIRGPRGTAVTLTVLREGWSNPKEISITRDIIQAPTLDWEIKDGNIAYARLHNFYEKAPYLFYRMAIDFSQYNPKGMVLDLRNDPGGYLNVAINLAGWFVEDGKVVVSEEFGNGEKQDYVSSGNGYFRNIPIVVLVNSGSASASEILAGALRDIRGSKLVGEKTFGKGTVQEVEQLSDGSLVKITVAHWKLPGGSIIEKNGLVPDYEATMTEEDFWAGRDPQLEKAIEVLRGQIQAENPSPLDRLLNVNVEILE